MGRSKTGGGDQATPLARSYQPVRAPRGAALTCQGWPQEAALRMLMNSLDPDVAEQPRHLIACGATGKVLNDWESYDATVEILKALKKNETLLVQSGRPAGVFKTRVETPRVMITNTHPANRMPTSGLPDQLEQPRPALPPQASTASWTYVGTQEALPAAFQTFYAIARKRFGGELAGKLIVSGGMGAAGGALPLAAAILGAAFLGVDIDGERIRRRIRAGYCDYCVNTLDEALRILKNSVRQQQAVSVGLVGNCADVIPELASRGVLPDILTDQTSAHDLLNGYIPSGLNTEEASALRQEEPEEYLFRARDSIVRHFNGILALQKLGSVVFEFGNSLCAAAERCGVAGAASAFPDFTEAYLQPLLSACVIPVRWVALSGDAGDIQKLDDLTLELLPDDALLARWVPLAQKYVRFQGLPARVLWMGQEARIRLAGRVNSLVTEGVFKAPMVISMDRADNVVEASPYADVEKQKNGIDLPTLNALLSIASGTCRLSLQIWAGYCQATVTLVADGTPAAAKAMQRGLKSADAIGCIGPLRSHP
jgi:urocanate hydratase